MSDSRLTVSPSFAVPKVVSSSVVGIRATSKVFVFILTEAMVRDTPLMVIEPLGTTNFRKSSVTLMATRYSSLLFVIFVILPCASMCPWTKCPPIAVVAVSAGSRFTGSPCISEPRFVFSSDSVMTSNCRSDLSSASVGAYVRQQPLTQMESPCAGLGSKFQF